MGRTVDSLFEWIQMGKTPSNGAVLDYGFDLVWYGMMETPLPTQQQFEALKTRYVALDRDTVHAACRTKTLKALLGPEFEWVCIP